MDIKQISRARIELRQAVNNGTLVRPSKCSDCGADNKIEAHHEDYNKPLNVIWLCSKCHKKRHPNFNKYDYSHCIISEIKLEKRRKKKNILYVRLDDELFNFIKYVADSNEISMVYAVREIIKKYYKKTLDTAR